MRTAPTIEADPQLQEQLRRLIGRPSTQQRFVFRAKIILAAMQGLDNTQIARQLDSDASSVSKWRRRWSALQEVPLSEMDLLTRLADAPRCGAPATISAEAYAQIMALACQPPDNFGRPITAWTARELAEEAMVQSYVPTISARQVGRFLKRSGSEATPKPLLAHQRARSR